LFEAGARQNTIQFCSDFPGVRLHR
jgi:hypothetical protein